MTSPTTAEDPDEQTEKLPPSWRYIPGRAIRSFTSNGVMDFAASLTYRALLSIVPAVVALVAIVSMLGASEEAVTSMLEEIQEVTPDDAWDTVGPLAESVLSVPSAGVGLGVGLVVTLWTASGYVRTFSRAMNAIYGVEEGRGVIMKNVQMYLLTVFLLLLLALGVIAFSLSTPVAEWLGGLVGLASATLQVWDVVRWIVIFVVIVLLVGLLYRATPNIRPHGMSWFSSGAMLAIIGIIVSSAVFFFYVANFGNYNATYGALASVIIAMLWGYIVNILLLAGAVLDCEIERTRQLRSGLPAEESLQLEARATTASDKLEDQLARDVERAREVRVAASELDETEEVVVLESPDMPAAPEATETSDAPTGTVAPSGTVATSRD
ncbi:MAG: YihY/virulence factor BrkB family protein [Candidatus Corynebacterium faecigallinarum]